MLFYSAVLIDTWWNVNTEETTISSDNNSVLIDTWWNVNTAVTYSDGYFGKVLIDTWWNVNQEQAQNLIRVNGF